MDCAVFGCDFAIESFVGVVGHKSDQKSNLTQRALRDWHVRIYLIKQRRMVV